MLPKSCFESLDKSLVDGLDVVQSVKIGRSGDVVSTMNADSQIFGHLSVLNCFNSCSLQSVTELLKFGKII